MNMCPDQEVQMHFLLYVVSNDQTTLNLLIFLYELCRQKMYLGQKYFHIFHYLRYLAGLKQVNPTPMFGINLMQMLVVNRDHLKYSSCFCAL
ncbi:unnamed protein product [Schistosoma margrebowiei]|uniref:Uncharacterized protein n=1 Tax=Schistosoma margrebowiei TaxID=48269 RepID=A0A3P8C6D8_9TREM|nr:unnamed protein product [Schistosoma margrebowiei]